MTSRIRHSTTSNSGRKPRSGLLEVQDFLKSNYYQPVLVDDIEEFSVVKEQYTEHADILRNSGMHWSRDGYNFFIMKDPVSVRLAVEQGATRLEDTDLVLGI